MCSCSSHLKGYDKVLTLSYSFSTEFKSHYSVGNVTGILLQEEAELSSQLPRLDQLLGSLIILSNEYRGLYPFK